MFTLQFHLCEQILRSIVCEEWKVSAVGPSGEAFVFRLNMKITLSIEVVLEQV